MKLSIGMMVKNEEKYMQKCLDAIKPILDSIDSELIIVDTGSTDKTIEIAKKYTEKIFFHKWEDDFAKMRNNVLKYAQGEWFLFIDADEIILKKEAFINIMNNNDINFDVGLIKFNNIMDIKNEDEKSVINLPRLFRNHGNLKFIGKIHELIPITGRIGDSKLEINHYGYILKDSKLMERKYVRNKELLEKELLKEPKNIYILHQLYQTHAMHKEFDKAAEYIKKAYDLIGNTTEDKFFNAYIYDGIVQSLMYLENYDEAEHIALEGLSVVNWHVDLAYMLGEIYFKKKNYKKCIESFERYQNLRNDFYENSFKNITIVAYSLNNIEKSKSYIGISYYYLCNFKKSLFIFESQNHENETFKFSIPCFILTVLKLKDYKKLKEMYIKIRNHDVLRKEFLQCLESEKIKFKNETSLIYKIEEQFSFLEQQSKEQDYYVELNKLRVLISNEYSEQELMTLMQLFENFEFENSDDYFGDVLYFNIITCKPILDSFKYISNQSIANFGRFIYLKYEGASKIFLNYIYKSIELPESTRHLRLILEIIKWIILDEITDKLDKQRLSLVYVSYLIVYIESYYSNSCIEFLKLDLCKTVEEKFQILIYKSIVEDNVELNIRINYLKEALLAYPILKEVVEVLINNISLEKYIEEDKTVNGLNENDLIYSEMNSYRKEIIEKLRMFIENGQIETAKTIIYESYDLMFEEIDYYSVKAIIAIIEGEYEYAKEILLNALKLDNANQDLLYNLAYVYEVQNNIELAVAYYHQVLDNTEDEDLINTVNNALKSLE